jgi:hypothetical protein
MGFFGLFGNDKKKKRVPPAYVVVPDEDESQATPWQQTIQQARQVRSNFFNNMSGQTWNRGKEKLKEARKRRRRHL